MLCKIVTPLLVVLAFAWPVGAATYTSKASGNYNADTTWYEGGNPGTNSGVVADMVTINSPHTVTVTAKYDASNDVVIVNSGATLATPTGGAGNNNRNKLSGVQIELRGGILATDVREWEGDQSGSMIIVASNSIIDTYDSYTYPQTIGHTYFGSLTIYPSVTKVTFTNSWWNTSPFEIASCAFTGGFSLSNSVEFCLETEKAHVELNNLSIDAGKILTKTGAGVLQVKGTPNINGNIAVNEGALQPLTQKCLGTNELTINPDATLFIDYLSGGTGLLGLPLSLNGGTLNYGYNSWAQTLRGAITIKSNSTINIYNYYGPEIHGVAISFDTLAFDAAPSGAGFELHCTHIGSATNWTNTVLYSMFSYASAISNNAVINADKYAGAWFDKALTIASNTTLTKKGEGVLVFNGAVTNAGSLVIEAGLVSNATANLSFSTLKFSILNATPGSGFGQLNVTTRNLTNTCLDVVADRRLHVGEQATLVLRSSGTISLKNLTGAAINEGNSFKGSDKSVWTLSYAGGDGNDVSVTLMRNGAAGDGAVVVVR